MSSVSFERLSADSPFATLRGFVTAHGLRRDGVPLKATSKAALYAQIVEAWRQPQPAADEPAPAVAPEAVASHEPTPIVDPPPSHAPHEPTPIVVDPPPSHAPHGPLVMLVDALFPDRLDALKPHYPFYNGVDPEWICARASRYVHDHRLAEGTLLYVGTARAEPEAGVLVVRDGRARPWEPDHGDLPPAYHAMIARGVATGAMRAHATLARVDRSTASPARDRASTPRRRWQHRPVQLAHADVVLHPPHPRAPPARPRWALPTAHPSSVSGQLHRRAWH